MSEQLDQGILERVRSLGTTEEVISILKSNPNAFDHLAITNDGDTVHYLAHHGVFKAAMKALRRVYGAKAKPCKGMYSLNDCLQTRPDLMNSLLVILLRFRKHKYAATSDIMKAFLQT